MAEVLTATTRAEEYELRAKYLKDDHQLSGDGPRSADFRIRIAMRYVSFSQSDGVLDISAGKWLLFQKMRAAMEIEPVIIPSNHGIFIEDATFIEMCRQKRLNASGFPTEEIVGISKSRWDYLFNPA